MNIRYPLRGSLSNTYREEEKRSLNCSIFRRLLADKGLVVTRRPDLFYLSGMNISLTGDCKVPFHNKP